jgi:hypothetical protein
MNPSALAIWLMTRFRIEDTLVGDLQEQAGRSTLWLWRQAAGAILVAIWQDFRVHWILAARAIFVGMVVWRVLLPLGFSLWRYLGGPFASVAALMGFTHPGIHATTVAMMILGLPSTFCIGWVIARFHRTRTPMPVIAFLIAVWLLWIPQYSRQVSNAIGDPRFRPYLLTQTLSICGFSLGVMAGGLWTRKPRATRPTTRIGPPVARYNNASLAN